jgi:hypothetical protein
LAGAVSALVPDADRLAGERRRRWGWLDEAVPDVEDGLDVVLHDVLRHAKRLHVFFAKTTLRTPELSTARTAGEQLNRKTIEGA